MKHLLTAFLFIVAVAGCKSANDSSPAVVKEDIPEASEAYSPSEPADKTADIKELTFMDSAVFDMDLSESLKEKYMEVKVSPSSNFTLNSIPERLDKWFFAVKESGGTVKAQAISADMTFRGVLGFLIDAVVAIFDALHEKTMYSPAKDYNVLIRYHKDTGNVDHVLFQKREG